MNLPWDILQWPLAAGADFIGILIFIIFAIISAWSQRKQAQGAEDEEAGTPSPSQRPAPRSQPETDPADELRKFLEGLQDEKPRPEPPAAPPPLPSQRPSTTHQAQPPQHVYKPQVRKPEFRKPPALPVRPPVLATAGFPEVEEEGPAHSDVHDEVKQSIKSLNQDMREISVKMTAPSMKMEASASSNVDLAPLRTASGLRQAFVFSQVMGPPRSLDPY